MSYIIFVILERKLYFYGFKLELTWTVQNKLQTTKLPTNILRSLARGLGK